MPRWIPAFCLAIGLAPSAQAQGLADCGFGFEIDAQSSAFQSMVVDGEQKRGFWLSINRAPSDVKKVARHIGRLQTCLVTPDGKPREITRGGRTFTLNSPFLGNCTATLLPDNRLLTNVHCFYDPDLVRAGFSIVREARVNFNYTSKDDTGAVRTYLVSPRELKLDKKLDAMVLQVIGGDPNGDLGGHVPMKMMPSVDPFQELRMIHHPAGEPQQYSTGTCQVHRRQAEIPPERSPLRHSCESTGGSSGSLLLDARTLAVVALHNQGGLRPSGDSFNSGHKIALINQALDLGFEIVTPEAAGGGGDAATSALTDALLIFDPTRQAEALRRVIDRFPNSEAAAKATMALDRLAGDSTSARETQAAQALSDALLTADLRSRISALRGVISQFAGTDAADKALAAASRLESDLASRDRDAQAQTRLDRAKADGDLDALRSLLSEFDGTAFGFQVQLALFEAESALRDAETAANTALTNALLLADRTAQIAALEQITRAHVGRAAATKAAEVLTRLRSTTPKTSEPVATKPAPKPKAPVSASFADPTPLVSPPSKLMAPITRAELETMARNGGRTQADVIARGYLVCGVSTGLPGFSFADNLGQWQGLDVDVCRAVAAAVLDDANAVQFVPLGARNRFVALASGEIDILSRNTSWTFSRDVDLKFDYPGITYFDGQGFMAPRSLGIDRATNLDGAVVCLRTGTSSELAVAEYFRANGMIYEPQPVANMAEAEQQYLAGACDVLTGDATGLAVMRRGFGAPGDHIILPEIISKEPLGPLVRHGDPQWTHLVSGVIQALLLSEQMELQKDTIPEIVDYLQNEPDGADLGTVALGGRAFNLPDDLMLRITAATGNYTEIFERNLSEELGLPLGLNLTSNAGGLHPVSFLTNVPTDNRRAGRLRTSSISVREIRQRGTLRCGVHDALPPYSSLQQGRRVGFAPDICRALAAAIFKDSDRVDYVIGADDDWAKMLADERADIIPTALSNDLSGDLQAGSIRGVPLMYPLYGAILPKGSHEDTLKQSGLPICALVSGHSRLFARHLFGSEDSTLVPVADAISGMQAMSQGKCGGVVGDAGRLAAGLASAGRDRSRYEIFQEVESPVVPIRPVMPGNENFRDFVNWTIFALIAAEELGLTQLNVDAGLRSFNPETRRLLGVEADLGPMMDLPKDWALQAILAVGNYGEIYERHFGAGSGLNIERAQNRIWLDGGLMYAPPFR
ncbi:transporter substrate-binding domain-containing protein [Mameliella sp. DP3N28-2]|nr:transporter substrate-binding domain-containing protein [Mameliella sediminis]